jgi:hypothetical protein
MRKHRLFGVVIAVFVGTGVLTHRSDSPHRISGTAGAGMQLASAELSAGHNPAIVHAIVHTTNTNSNTNTTATNTTATNTTATIAAPSAASLPFPFAGVQLVTDYRAATAREAIAVNAYLTALAQERFAVNMYLTALAKEHNAVRTFLAALVPRPAAPATAVGRDPWPALRQCESSGNYTENTGNGYYGAYQFTAGTWASLGFAGLPSQAPPAVQDLAAQELQARRGWGQWPSCARRLGLL